MTLSRASKGGRKSGLIRQEKAIAKRIAEANRIGIPSTAPVGLKTTAQRRKYVKKMDIQIRRESRYLKAYKPPATAKMRKAVYGTWDSLVIPPEEKAESGIRGERKAGRRKRKKLPKMPFDKKAITKKELEDANAALLAIVPPDMKEAGVKAKGKGKGKGKAAKDIEVADEYEGIIRFPIFYDIDIVLDIHDKTNVSDAVKKELIEYVKRTGVKGRGRPRVIERLLGQYGVGRARGGKSGLSIAELAKVLRSRAGTAVPLEDRRRFFGTPNSLYSAYQNKRVTKTDSGFDEDTSKLITTRTRRVEKVAVKSAIKVNPSREEYLRQLNTSLVENGVITETVYQFLSVISMLKQTLMIPELKLKAGDRTHFEYELSKMNIMPLMAELMAEFIESGARERLKAQGLGASALYKSFKCYPFYVSGSQDKEIMELISGKKHNLPVYMGVMVEMKHYGVYVDLGRGPTVNSMGPYDDLTDSPFYKALYQWALDNVHMWQGSGGDVEAAIGHDQDSEGKYRGNTGREVGEKRPELLATMPISRVAIAKYGDSVQLAIANPDRRGASAFMREYGGDNERRAVFGSEDNKAAGGREVRIRNVNIDRTRPVTFDQIVFLIYRAINKGGFAGNHFLADTLAEMMETGKMEYYFSVYLEDALNRYSNRHAKSVLHDLPTAMTIAGQRVEVKKG